LQSDDSTFEVEDLPERNAEIQKPDTANRAANPAGSNHSLQSLNARFARRIEQKIIVAPIADAPHAVRPPWRHREKDTNLEAQDNVENNT